MKAPIYFVENPQRFASFLLGLASITDGLIRTLSLGFFGGRFQLETTKWCLQREFTRLKKLAGQTEVNK